MRSTQPKLLIVDDDPSLATPICLLLKDRGYEVAVAFSGEEAVGVAAWYAPDILISDVQMGALNGVDAAREIVARLPLCQVLLASGNGDSSKLVDEANAAGHDFQFMAKPYSFRQLVAQVSRMALAAAAPPAAARLARVS